MHVLLPTLLVIVSIFMILLVLVQRGRGGGLAGALGGAGGQSAFGTKAGDLFTRITIAVAAVWILLCVASVKSMSAHRDNLFEDDGVTQAEEPSVQDPFPPATGPEGDAASGGLGSSATPPPPPAPPAGTGT